MNIPAAMTFCALAVTLGAAVADTTQSSAPPKVARSSLFEARPGDVLEDAGVMVVSGGTRPRSETFEVVRRADGDRVVTGIIEAADGAWRVEGRWAYDDTNRALSATGTGRYGNRPVSIEIVDVGAIAEITATVRGETQRDEAPCEPCLMDLAPSILPIFTMTRLYDAAVGGTQRFHWVGHDLLRDQVLTNGQVAIRLLGTETVQLPDGRELAVTRYAFNEPMADEPMADETGGRTTVRLNCNLYVDADNRPLGFATPLAVGMRRGFEALPKLLPPVLDTPAAGR
ncbi:MAG: hypothetical protein LJE69_00600 [Thiohalocapsa sp.]|uniref:hypothetical protein n=1 Tax=Thiohalocapsa sp. TaxID=2497641 RepID=UPI0025FB8ACD|nr:hypothetical protein [Thiohalocapsa sp.]MCG6939738.1 hypothetical protein [Thiohalocapsa sp.]